MHKIRDIDKRFAFYFTQFYPTHPRLNEAMKFISSCGDYGMSWLIIILATNLYGPTHEMSIKMLIALIVSTLVGQFGIKSIVRRPRPCHTYKNVTMLIPIPSDLSFPSGHTTASFACSTIILLYFPLFGIIGMIYALLTGFSRLYLFVHYISDVTIGMALGILIGLIVYL